MTPPILAADVLAPAKINLTLHVTGQRADGYHFLDSLVVFAAAGDQLRLQAGNALSLTVEGPEAVGVPADARNLVLQVAELFEGVPGASFSLTKNLPSAAGIGGGSADAAAAYRALDAFYGGASEDLEAKLLALGADIPVCLPCKPSRMRGVGERVDPASGLPPIYAVLANPRVGVPTPQVFSALENKSNAPMPDHLPHFDTPASFADWLGEMRNDLEAPASLCAPVILDVLSALADLPKCLLARMSGSGATCFGLFADLEQALSASKSLAAARPDWWVCASALGDMQAAAAPILQRAS